MLTLESPAADFRYEPALADDGEWQATLSVFADDAEARRAVEGDLGEAGFRLANSGALSTILDGGAAVLGDVVVVDCASADAGAMAALSRLDERVARAGSRLVVATTMNALEMLFLCFEKARVHWLVDASHGERLVALAEARLRLTARVRELSDEDRATLERLATQVGAIAERISLLTERADTPSGSGFAFESPGQDYRAEPENGDGECYARQPRPALPDPRLIRKLIAQRQARAKFFPQAHFADPAWDMLLDLAAARAEHQRVFVTSLAIASGVPPTTALRWIAQLEEAGLVERVADDVDKRRAFLTLSDKAADAMAAYFAEFGPSLPG